MEATVPQARHANSPEISRGPAVAPVRPFRSRSRSRSPVRHSVPAAAEKQQPLAPQPPAAAVNDRPQVIIQAKQVTPAAVSVAAPPVSVAVASGGGGRVKSERELRLEALEREEEERIRAANDD